MQEENVLLNETFAFVSNLRVRISGTTYSTANLTSVRKGVTLPRKGSAIILLFLGLLILPIPVSSFLHIFLEPARAGVGVLFFSTFLCVGLIVLGAARLIKQQVIFHVIMTSASGEVQALDSKDEHAIDRVVQAISDAIVQRG